MGMGIVRAAFQAAGGTLADQWLEVIEPLHMENTTVCTKGVSVRRNDKRGGNRKGSADVISNGSVIHVYPNQFMLLLDGGKVVDYTAEEGYYTVNHSSSPSLFQGSLSDSVRDFFERVSFGGATPSAQKVYYINLQEIQGIKFGTRSPINYFDNAYNAELFLRAHGTYSIKITDPLRFYWEAAPHGRDTVDIEDINEQYLSEFLEALQSAINQMSADGLRISYVASKGRELSRYMSTILDADWKQTRGMEVQSVGIASISYDEQSTRLIHMRNEGAMLSDPSVREGYVQGAAARGLEAAGSNPNGSMAGFLGMEMGMRTGGVGAFSQANQRQMQEERDKQPAPGGWSCSCGAQNKTDNKFCSECGAKRPEKEGWICPDCSAHNTGKFCVSCGKKKPAARGFRCAQCGFEEQPAQSVRFCPECGKPADSGDWV